MYKRVFLILAFLSATVYAKSQDSTSKIDALNTFADFTNESIHGMLIVHRLLENFNQDINKYVDLESYQLNFYSNKDLPKNIFVDKEHWFYQVSPIELYARLPNASAAIHHGRLKELNKECTILKNIFTAVNKLRFDVEKTIDQNDLTTVNGLNKVYNLLESGVKMYDDFSKHQIAIENILHEMHPEKKGSVHQKLFTANQDFKNILRALRSKSTENFEVLINKASKESASAITALKNANFRNSASKIKKIDTKMSQAVQAANEFYKTAEVPDEFKLYGKFYYYHNANIINKINRYGNGYVFEVNTLFSKEKKAELKLIEEVQFYQIVYPEKLKTPDLIVSSEKNIETTPIELKLRSIKKSNHIIVADKVVFELDLFDYKIKDGDIVSINYNGDWILENYSLEGEPTKLKFKLNKNGKNYLLLHAVNVGRNPPNTMAVAYNYRGEKKKIILSSDMNESTLIEIQLDN